MVNLLYLNNLSIIVLIIFVLSCKSYDIDSCKNYRSTEKTRNCYSNYNLTKYFDTCLNYNKFIKWSVGKDNILKIEFDLALQCNFSLFEINLYVQENAKNCETNQKFTDIHSKLKYTRINTLNSIQIEECNSTALVEFKYIYRGCYYIELRASGKSMTSEKLSAKRFIETNYTKEIFKNDSISTLFQYRDSDQTPSIITNISNKIYNNNIKFCYELSNSSFHLVWNVSCPLAGNKTKCDVSLIKNDKKINCVIKKVTEILLLSCMIYEIDATEYNLRSTLISEPIRCNLYSVWREKCVWDSDILLTTKEHTEENNFDIIYVIVITLSIIVFIILVIITTTKYYKKIKNRNLRNVVIDYHNSMASCLLQYDILLLYPKDCDEFMDAMATLRNTLQTYNKCTVYDIYDLNGKKEILKDQNNWILSKLKDDQIKIILVTTKCGDILINSNELAAKIYRNPFSYDSLFQYGVKHLLSNMHLHSTEKLFIAKFQFDENELNFAYSLNSFPLFYLDNLNSLQALLSELFSNSGNINLDDFCFFQEKCKEIQKFIARNPDYLHDDIFNITL